MIEINLSHIHVHTDPVVRKRNIYVFTEKDPHVYFTVHPGTVARQNKDRCSYRTNNYTLQTHYYMGYRGNNVLHVHFHCMKV